MDENDGQMREYPVECFRAFREKWDYSTYNTICYRTNVVAGNTVEAASKASKVYPWCTIFHVVVSDEKDKEDT